jgi:lysophospholipase L1-like esterase
MTEKEVNVTYIDLFPLLADDNNMLIEEYSDDGLHLNAAGFEVWTNLIKPYLIG